MTTTPTTPTKPEASTLIHLDPHALASHPANVRSKLGSVKDLTASIASVGVIEPIIVAPEDDGGWRILAGHRRNKAAIEAGLKTVPCIARADLGATDLDSVSAMLQENLHREALTAGDEARAVHQLTLGGLSATQIAKRTGLPAKRVKAGIAVGGNDTAQAITSRYDVTLEQAIVIGEFSDDDEAVKRLTVCAIEHPGQFDHLAQQLKDRREQDAKRAAAIAEWEGKGYKIVTAYDEGTDLADLLNDKGKAITPAAHKTCEHRAVRLGWEFKPTHLCLDPKAAGHTKTKRGQGGSREAVDTEAAAADRAAVIAGNKAWRSAETVRLAYVHELAARRKAPAGVIELAAFVAVTEPTMLADASDLDVAAILGRGDDGLDKWSRRLGAQLIAAEPLTPARAAMLLLVQIAAAYEARLDTHSWRSPRERDAHWLRFLESTGYVLSEIEQSIVDTALKAQAALVEDEAPTVLAPGDEPVEPIVEDTKPDLAVVPDPVEA